MGRAIQPFRAGESVSWQVDGTHVPDPLKGNRARAVVKMPREPHRLGAASHEAAPASEAGGRLGMANTPHQRLKCFLDRFAEVSTRRFPHHLAWFEWVEQVRRSGSRPAR